MFNLYHSLGIFSRRQIYDIFLIFPRLQDLTFGDNLHEMAYAVFWENKKNIPKCRLLKILPRVLSVNSQCPEELPMSTTNLHDPKDVRVFEVRLYIENCKPLV